jgi:acyl carrier protein
MKRPEIVKQLNEIFESIIDEGPVFLSDSTTASDVGGWDSLANIQLIVAIEKSMNIRFTSEEIQMWKNVGEMVDCISTKYS